MIKAARKKPTRGGGTASSSASRGISGAGGTWSGRVGPTGRLPGRSMAVLYGGSSCCCGGVGCTGAGSCSGRQAWCTATQPSPPHLLQSGGAWSLVPHLLQRSPRPGWRHLGHQTMPGPCKPVCRHCRQGSHRSRWHTGHCLGPDGRGLRVVVEVVSFTFLPTQSVRPHVRQLTGLCHQPHLVLFRFYRAYLPTRFQPGR
jgi:hypothetical protein